MKTSKKAARETVTLTWGVVTVPASWLTLPSWDQVKADLDKDGAYVAAENNAVQIVKH